MKPSVGPIGICGLAGSGKDTFADRIITILGKRKAVKYSLAAPIKQIAMIFGFTKDQMYDPLQKEAVDPFWKITPRWFAQRIGTDMFRDHFREDVWIKLAEKFVEDNRNKTVVIPDVRFDNEAKFIRDFGGILVKMERDSSGLKGEAATHASEQGVDPDLVTLRVTNNGSMDDLEESAQLILETYGYFDL